jgi:transposase
MALDLGSRSWKVAFAIGVGHAPRVVTVPAGELGALTAQVARARRRFGLPATAPVRSCYEAGRDGFWLHRALGAQGIANEVVNPCTLSDTRRRGGAKTDRLDATALLTQLQRASGGDRRDWRVVHVPSVEAEATRHLEREWATVRTDRQRVRNRILGLLQTQGVRLPPRGGDWLARLAAVRLWDGTSVPAAVQQRLAREWAQLQALEARRAALQAARRAQWREGDGVVAEQTRRLMRLRGVGEISAGTLSAELFAWRQFTAGSQVAAVVGLTPTPARSDHQVRERGISRQGNGHVRALSVELAWAWRRWQPDSALSQWFHARFGQHGRARRIGIVAVARKLVIALWRYVDQGVLPEGARLTA